MKIHLLEHFTFNDAVFTGKDNEGCNVAVVCVLCEVASRGKNPPDLTDKDWTIIWSYDQSVAALFTWIREHLTTRHPTLL